MCAHDSALLSIIGCKKSTGVLDDYAGSRLLTTAHVTPCVLRWLCRGWAGCCPCAFPHEEAGDLAAALRHSAALN